LLSATIIGGLALSVPALAQDANRDDIIVVTGTRIQSPNIVSASPVTTIGQQELDVQQTPDIERVFRDLPLSVPGDGQNVNNGTAGAATLNLRNLGTQRTLLLINGQRMVPYDINGVVDVSTVPMIMLERVDIVTGGASAVYGSDAMAGAVNFILQEDFTGVELNYNYQQTESNDGTQHDISVMMGAELDGGRGNVVAAMNHTHREPVRFGDRDWGVFGVNSATGAGVGVDAAAAAAPAECDAPGAVATDQSGSTTGMPTTLDLISGSLQYRNDTSLGAPCSLFNFNPFNYYQTPRDRFSGGVLARYEVNDHAEVYSRAMFSSTNVTQRVAPSGVFGTQMLIPLMNPFLSAANRTRIMDDLNTFLAANPAVDFATAGIVDLNNNGILDLADSINVPVRRRTLELGERSTSYDQNQFQFTIGLRGDLPFLADWNYDVYLQHGETDRTNTSAGYTDVGHIANALNTVSATSCTTPGGSTTSGCVPLNIFGGYGTITPEMAAYSSATAIETRHYVQNVFSATATGPTAFQLPTAEQPIYLAFGLEYRDELGSSTPDECWKKTPASCLGGAGGNRLPVSSDYSVREGFIEAQVPLIQGRQLVEDLSLELGWRYSHYDPNGGNDTWKAGLSWQVMDGLRFRYMEQQAVRAPNVAELGSPVTSSLNNATMDPCSIANAGNIDAALTALCISTGVPASLVGLVPDIVSGQVNTFSGTDPINPPGPETGRTTTFGVVWQPNLPFAAIQNPTISVDYYDINITDTIGAYSANEALNNCYVLGDPAACAGIQRISGSLGTSGAGVSLYTTNLNYIRAEGIEFAASFGTDIGRFGDLSFSLNANYYLTQENQSSDTTPVITCIGHYGTSCNPTPETRWVQRTTWTNGAYSASLNWRHIGEMTIEPVEASSIFPAFRQIDAYNYFDLSGSYQMSDGILFRASVSNLLAELPPIIGNTTGSTAFNNGNTFPSTYDAFGRVFTVGVSMTF
tara:strand:- start:26642 stop:29569 length:2928 start_codon:yes stop_codon:yes gene_type:complete